MLKPVLDCFTGKSAEPQLFPHPGASVPHAAPGLVMGRMLAQLQAEGVTTCLSSSNSGRIFSLVQHSADAPGSETTQLKDEVLNTTCLAAPVLYSGFISPQ